MSSTFSPFLAVKSSCNTFFWALKLPSKIRRKNIRIRGLPASRFTNFCIILSSFQKQSEPKRRQFVKGFYDSSGSKKLRRAVGAVIMRYSRFREFKAGSFGFFNQFRENSSGVAGQSNLVKNLAAHQTKITINIPDFQLKKKSHDILIQKTDNEPIKRVVSFNLVPVNKIHAVVQFFHQIGKLVNVILRVAVGIKNQVFSRRPKSALQDVAVTQRFFVKNRAQFRNTLCKLQKQPAGAVI